MKKIFTLTIALLTMLAVNAQVLLSEGFESGTLPNGWTVIDSDGDSYTWDATYLYQESPSYAHTGDGMISSASYSIDVGALTPDNWLITPAVNLTSYATLSFWLCAQDADYAAEHYGIYISTTSIDISDFTLLYEETIDANGGEIYGAWMQKTVDLSSYIGQTIYIAFRHFNCTDQFVLNLDDVEIIAQAMTEPTITVFPTSLDFGSVALGSTSSIQTVLLTNFNLTTDVTVTTSVPFEVSSDGIVFSTTALIPSEGGTLYLRYTPIAPNYNIGTLTLSSIDALDVTIPLSGFAVDCSSITIPYNCSFDNESQIVCWEIHDANNDGNLFSIDIEQGYAYCSNHSSNAADDWIISPVFALTGDQIASFDYYSANESNPEKFQVFAFGPDTVALTPVINVDRTTAQMQLLNLQGLNGDYKISIHCASDANEYGLYIDNFSLFDFAGIITTSYPIDFGDQTVNEASLPQQIDVIGVSLQNDITVVVSDYFEVSTDGISFTNTVTLPAEGANLYVRFIPSTFGIQTGVVTLTCDTFSRTAALSGFGIGNNYSQIVYVTPTGAGNRTGNSWENATSSIATAQTLAQTHNAVVWVAAGIYYGNTSSDNAFTMVDGVDVFGGFAGNEPANYDLSQRNFETNASILDGQQTRRVLYQPYNYGGVGSTWDGFTIRNGNVIGDEIDDYYVGGGAVLSFHGELSNCLITNNTAYGSGGGVYAYSGAITDCQISNNIANYDGGGVIAYNSTITNCHIFNNIANYDGGGVKDRYNSVITNCQIYNNTANTGGGVIVHSGTVSNCQISNNTAVVGGGVTISDGSIVNTTIVRNYSSQEGSGVYGGGNITNCIVWGNGTTESNNILGNLLCSYSAIEGSASGTHNILLSEQLQQTPLFVNPSLTSGATDNTPNVNWHLLPGSPCINRGDNTSVIDSLDLDGNPRIRRDTVDIGCFESDYYSTAITMPEYTGVIYVTQNGAGSQTGENWSNATSSISFAMSMAAISHSVVWVASGIYYGDTMHSNAFTMVNGVNVYGGFVGNEPSDYDLSQRDFETNASVLDGQQMRRVLYQPTNFSTETIWDGFTIQNGNATSYSGGGGACLLKNGVLIHCRISNNTAGSGGGVAASHSTISNCQIFNNNSNSSGGGISASDSCIILNCQMSNNLSNYYGGGINASNSTISNCQISNNTSTYYGGGISAGTCVLSNCQIYNNNADNGGGGMYIVNSTVCNCDISSNTANYSGGVNLSNSAFSHCIVSNNTASSKFGGLYANNSTILNSTIVRNYSIEGSGVFGDSDNNDTTTVMTNCIVWGNSSSESLELNNNVQGKVNCSYSAIEGGAWGTHNIILSDYLQQIPLFVNPSLTAGSNDSTSNIDWHLLSGSPCINHGLNSVVVDSVDLDGNPRIMRDTVDMGCFETEYYSVPVTTPEYTDIIYVTPNGAGNLTGESWSNATSSINFATTMASSYQAAVWIAGGTYYGNTMSDEALIMKEGVNVYGSFAGTEPANYDLSLRDFEANASILDGQNTRRVLVQPYAFGTSTVWDGFVICRGKVVWDNDGYYIPQNECAVFLQNNGGLSHCQIINNNRAGVSTKFTYTYNNNVDRAINITNCQINNNNSAGVHSSYGHTIITNCQINNNNYIGVSVGYGSVISNCQISNNNTGVSMGNSTIENCQIYDNTSVGVSMGSSNINNCHIFNNGTGITADGNSLVSNCMIYNNNGKGVSLEASIIKNCQVYGNLDGGVSALDNSMVSHCQITNNTSSVNGGGINAINSTISNCLISNNTTANSGGGVRLQKSSITNATIVRNNSNSGTGGGVWGNGSITNCIVWGNEKQGLSDNLSASGILTCSYSAVEGGYQGDHIVPLDSNLFMPLFVNPSLTAGADDNTSNVDWHLLQGSSCANRGLNSAVFDSVDFDGLARIKHDTVDAGCYESDYYTNIPIPWNSIIYVTTTGAGARTGMDWANALSSIDSALSLAQNFNSVVWVAAGTYYGDTTSTESAFTMIEGVNVYGGFAGNEPEDYVLSLRDFEAHATILDGQQTRRVLNQTSIFNTPTTWDGFAIRNGNVSSYGGGAYLRENGLLSHCILSNNTAKFGGGMYAYHGTILNCQITDNTTISGRGGGMYIEYSTVSYCQLSNNSSNYGGGVYALHSTISHCQISNDSAQLGGGMCAFNSSNVSNCLLYNNTSSGSAGGMYAESVVVSNCFVYNNTAVNSGGGMFLYESIVYNCLLSNNTASKGGGIIDNYHSAINNTTIVNNQASLSGGGVKGYFDFWDVYGNTTMTNCIVWGNESNGSKNLQNVSCSYSAIEGGYEGDSIITLSGLNPPYFVNPSLTAGAADSTPNVDWHLQQGSVCINRGNNNAVMDSLDLDGLARIQRDTVDLGCYESDYYSSPLLECVTQFSELTETACDSYVWNDSIYTQTGDYTQTLTDVYGCDSVVTVHLTIYQSTHNAETITACDSYEWHGELYDTSGIYIYEYTNMDGCPSTDTLYLTINYSTNSIDEHVACESLTWMDGITYTESTNTPTYTITNAVGCDSIITLHLTIKPSVTEDFEVVICDSYSWNDSVYTQSGDYTQTFTAANGCDSVVTLHLTINNSNATEFSAIACDSYTWNDSVYTQSGDYTQAFETVHGCDSVVTLHLTINTSDHIDLTAVACGQYVWKDSTYTISGNYSVTYTNAEGCDSIVTLHLTVNPIPDVAITGNTTICPGGGTLLTATGADTYMWSNYSTNASIPVNMFGVYSVTGTTSAGCYNTATVTVLVAQPPVITVSGDLELCAGETGTITAHGGTTYMWSNGSTDSTLAVSGAGTWQVIGYDENGCNGMASATVTVWQPVTMQFTVTVNDSCYVWNTVSYCESGDYTQSFQSVHGCDSVVTLHLILTNTVYEDIYETACDSYTWNNATYSQSGDYVQTFTLADGSDSVVTLHLTLSFTDHTDMYVSECESYTWNGVIYTESGDYTLTFTNSNGCDSVVTLHLTINNPVHTALTAAACGSYEWNGTTYTVSGDYTYSHLDVNGCTQVDTLHLTINNSTTGDTTAAACNSFTWQGETYSQSGDYTSYMSNANGCDSVVTLHLSIYQDETSEFSIVTDDPCYTWNSVEYCESGDYTQTLQTIHGCDSIVTLHLTITVGIDDYETVDFKVYPNPTNDIVNVECTMNNVQFGEAEIQVVDMYGKLVDVVGANNYSPLRTARIDLSRYASGIYFVKWVAEDKTIAVRKVVKQ